MGIKSVFTPFAISKCCVGPVCHSIRLSIQARLSQIISRPATGRLEALGLSVCLSCTSRTLMHGAGWWGTHYQGRSGHRHLPCPLPVLGLWMSGCLSSSIPEQSAKVGCTHRNKMQGAMPTGSWGPRDRLQAESCGISFCPVAVLPRQSAPPLARCCRFRSHIHGWTQTPPCGHGCHIEGLRELSLTGRSKVC